MDGPEIKSKRVFVTITLQDSNYLPEIAQAAQSLDSQWAVLQGDGPSLSSVLDALTESGYEEIELIGLCFGIYQAPINWVIRVARYWLTKVSINPPTITVHPKVLSELPTKELTLGKVKAITLKNETLTNPAWEKIPNFSTHLLICHGPRCSAKGAETITAELGNALRKRELLSSQTLVTQTGCLYPCNHAPVVAVHPLGEWFGPITTDLVEPLANAIVTNDFQDLPKVARKTPDD